MKLFQQRKKILLAFTLIPLNSQQLKTQWSVELRLNVQRKVEALLAHNVPVKEETLERLCERGIHIS